MPIYVTNCNHTSMLEVWWSLCSHQSTLVSASQFFQNGALSSHSNCTFKVARSLSIGRACEIPQTKSIQIASDGWKAWDFRRFFTSRCVKPCPKNVWASARGNAEDISKGRQTTNPGAWTNLKCCPPLPLFRSQERAACDYLSILGYFTFFFL